MSDIAGIAGHKTVFRLIFTRLPLIIVTLGFTNVLSMPILRLWGLQSACVASALLTLLLFSGSVIYYFARGLSLREIIDSKFIIDGTSPAVPLIGLLFLIGGIVIMSTARDIENPEPDQMTRSEQRFFGSTFALMGAGAVMMPTASRQKRE